MSGSNNPDYFEIEADGSSIKIEQMRGVQKTIYEKPIISNRKVYLIKNSESMTKEAQNSLLKILEEPPEYVCIILASNNNNAMLTTIKSRCVKIVLSRNEDKGINLPNDIKERVNKIFANIENINLIDIINSKEEIFTEKESTIITLEYISSVFLEKLNRTQDNSYITCIELIEKTKDKLKRNNNYDMTLDNFLIKTWETVRGEYGKYNRSKI